MENIKVEDMKNTGEVSATEMENVKGGPAFLKLEGVDGEASGRKDDGWVKVLTVSTR